MNKTVSIILLSYFSNDRINTAYKKISSLFDAENISFELIIVDDGSTDDSFPIALGLEKIDNRVKAFRLSRNYTSHYAAFAGLSVSKGDCAVLIPDDEQLPYMEIINMFRIWELGEKIIMPFRKVRHDSLLISLTSNFFYRIMNGFSEIKFPEGGADSFFIDREIIDILNEKIHPIRTTTVTEILRLGFEPFFHPYVRPIGINNKSRWSFKKKLTLAKDFFYSSSIFPIKLIINLGLFFSFFSLVFIIFYVYVKMFGNQDYWGLANVPGWLSTVVLLSFFSGMILFCLGIIAEYTWRIYEEVKGRPGYIIRKK
jgi:glycosyltransferase involved in cell wall biosynthesis